MQRAGMHELRDTVPVIRAHGVDEVHRHLLRRFRIRGRRGGLSRRRRRGGLEQAESSKEAQGHFFFNSISETMNPNAGQPPDATERSNHLRALVVSPRTRYQLPMP